MDASMCVFRSCVAAALLLAGAALLAGCSGDGDNTAPEPYAAPVKTLEEAIGTGRISKESVEAACRNGSAPVIVRLKLPSVFRHQEMVAEIPTPTEEFVGDCPWIENISQAQQEVADKLIRHLMPAAFSLRNGKYMPHGAALSVSGTSAEPGLSFTTPPAGSGMTQPLFQTAIAPTQARIT
jgi:hypothetical protein